MFIVIVVIVSFSFDLYFTR